MRFARWVFLAAGVYGFIVLTPLYALEGAVSATQGPVTHPEYYYGFVGCALAFQLLFLVIARDPARLRPAMLAGIVEKAGFPAAVWPLFLQHRAPAAVTAFASIDLIWGVLFVISYVRTAGTAAQSSS
jgi:hypothetical protein